MLSMAVLTSTAQAAPITYTFPTGASQNLGNATIFNSSPLGFDVTATAYARNAASDSNPWVTSVNSQNVQVRNVDSAANGDGLGVSKPGLADNANGQNAIDSRGSWIEGIVFDFGALALDSATIRFGDIDNWDKVIVRWGDAPPDFSIPASGQPTLFPNTSTPLTIASVGTATGTAKEFSYEYLNLGGARYLFVQATNDNLASVNCTTTNVNCFRVNGIDLVVQASTVPEPEGLGLLGLAAAGMGLVSLRRKRR
jgi:hypothetical protein